MSDRNGQRQPGGAGAASEDLIALAGQQEPTAPAVVAQEKPKPRKGMVLEKVTARPTEVIDHFDWESGEHVVVWEQPRTAVYYNQREQTIIKQMAPYPEEDVFLMFNRESLPDLIRKLAEHIDGPNGNSAVWDAVHRALAGYDL